MDIWLSAISKKFKAYCKNHPTLRCVPDLLDPFGAPAKSMECSEMETWKESQLKRLTFAKGVETAYPILLQFAENLGFNYCAVSVVSLHRDTPLKTLQINNYPDEWNSQYEENNYGKVDPLIAHCNHSMTPIVWCESVFADSRQLWQGLQQHGLQHGWSQSFHHEQSGLCSIISLARKHCPISALELYEHFGYMFYATSHLSELFARTLPRESLKPRQPHLSPRELEVLQLSAGGKTAYENLENPQSERAYRELSRAERDRETQRLQQDFRCHRGRQSRDHLVDQPCLS